MRVIACPQGRSAGMVRIRSGKAGAMPTAANVVRATLGSRRGTTDDRLYARATPEKVEITETYSVTQEISNSPNRDRGEPTGRIEMVIPYDGADYFTRQAAGDVERAGAGRGQ